MRAALQASSRAESVSARTRRGGTRSDPPSKSTSGQARWVLRRPAPCIPNVGRPTGPGDLLASSSLFLTLKNGSVCSASGPKRPGRGWCGGMLLSQMQGQVRCLYVRVWTGELGVAVSMSVSDGARHPVRRLPGSKDIYIYIYIT